MLKAAVLLGFTQVLLAVGVWHRDRAMSLVGNWTCTTAAGNTATHTYARSADGLVMRDTFILHRTGKRITLQESYRFDARTATWTLASTATPLVASFKGTAGAVDCRVMDIHRRSNHQNLQAVVSRAQCALFIPLALQTVSNVRT